MKYIQEQFISMLYLDGLKKVGLNKYNCRCPYCNDSKVSKKKKRGWFLWNQPYNTYVFYCHNCSKKTNFKNMLKDFNNVSFQSYLEMEKQEEFNSFINLKPAKKIELSYKQELEESISLEYLPDGTVDCKLVPECLAYLQKRKIPQQFIDKWKYNKRFGLIVPFEFEEGEDFVYGWQSRKLNKKEFKISLPEDNPKIWNLFSVKENKNLYITESIIDSCMLYHIGLQSISMLGSDLHKEILDNFKKVYFIFDNDETGRKKTLKYSQIFTDAHFLIWDKRIKQKDLNEIITSGVPLEKFKKFIETSFKSSIETYTLLTLQEN